LVAGEGFTAGLRPAFAPRSAATPRSVRRTSAPRCCPSRSEVQILWFLWSTNRTARVSPGRL